MHSPILLSLALLGFWSFASAQTGYYDDAPDAPEETYNAYPSDPPFGGTPDESPGFASTQVPQPTFSYHPTPTYDDSGATTPTDTGGGGGSSLATDTGGGGGGGSSSSIPTQTSTGGSGTSGAAGHLDVTASAAMAGAIALVALML